MIKFGKARLLTQEIINVYINNWLVGEMDPNITTGLSLIIQVALFLTLGTIILKKNKSYTVNIYFAVVFFSVGIGCAVNIIARIFFEIQWLYLLCVRLVALSYLIPFFTFITGFVAIVKGIKYFKENNGIIKSAVAISIACIPVLIWPFGVEYTSNFNGRYYIISYSLGIYLISLILLSMTIISLYLPLNLWNWNKIMNLRIILLISAMGLFTLSTTTIILVGMRILDTNLLGTAALISNVALLIMLFNFLTPFERRRTPEQNNQNLEKNMPKKLE